MIERKFVKQNVKEFQIRDHIMTLLAKSGVSDVKLQLTPLGEKIVVYTSRPGLVVGKGGENIKNLTIALKKRFELENPQIEISEIENPNLNAQIVADHIATYLERHGSRNFKGIMHNAITNVMSAGARGVEIALSGKIPSTRAKTWRVLSGYMKKCGDIAVSKVDEAQTYAQLKSGTIGVKVKIMPAGLILPDYVELIEDNTEQISSQIIDEGKKIENKDQKSPNAAESKEKKERKPRKKKTESPKPEESQQAQKEGIKENEQGK